MAVSNRRNRPTLRLIVTILLLAMGWTFGGVGTALAGWDDRSDELPGMDNSLTPVFIAGGVLLVLVLVLKSKKGDDKSEGDAAPKAGSDRADPADEEEEFGPVAINRMAQCGGAEAISLPTIRPLAGVSQSTAVVGVSLGF
jgi:hypothetical protein